MNFAKGGKYMKHVTRAICLLALFVVGATLTLAQTCTPGSISYSKTNSDNGVGPLVYFTIDNNAPQDQLPNGTVHNLPAGPHIIHHDHVTGWVDDRGGFGGCLSNMSYQLQTRRSMVDQTTNTTIWNEPNWIISTIISCGFVDSCPIPVNYYNGFDESVNLISGHTYIIWDYSYAIIETNTQFNTPIYNIGYVIKAI